MFMNLFISQVPSSICEILIYYISTMYDHVCVSQNLMIANNGRTVRTEKKESTLRVAQKHVNNHCISVNI